MGRKVSDSIGTSSTTFGIGILKALLSATGLTALRTFVLPDRGGNIALDDLPRRIITGNITLTDTDHDTLIITNSASAIVITVPTGLRTDFTVQVFRENTGAVSFAASGTTLQPSATLTIGAQYRSVVLFNIHTLTANNLRLVGALA